MSNGFQPAGAALHQTAKTMLTRFADPHPMRPTMAEAVAYVDELAMAYVAGEFGEGADALAEVRRLCTGAERCIAALKMRYPPHIRTLLDDLVIDDANREGHSIIPCGDDFYVLQKAEIASAHGMYRRETDQETGEVKDVVLFPYLYSNGSPQYRENPAIRKPRSLSPEAQAAYGRTTPPAAGFDLGEWFTKKD